MMVMDEFIVFCLITNNVCVLNNGTLVVKHATGKVAVGCTFHDFNVCLRVEI